MRHNVEAIVKNIRTGTSFLSRNTRNQEVEVDGRVVQVSQTTRGLTLSLDSKKKVIWQCPKAVASAVVAAYTSTDAQEDASIDEAVSRRLITA